MTCPRCGHENPAAVTFCGAFGARLVLEKAEMESAELGA